MFTVTPLYQVTLVLVAIACIIHTKEPEKQEQVLLTPKFGKRSDYHYLIFLS